MEKIEEEEMIELIEWNKFLLAEKLLFLTGFIIHYFIN